jgi:hypothetical protein
MKHVPVAEAIAVSPDGSTLIARLGLADLPQPETRYRIERGEAADRVAHRVLAFAFVGIKEGNSK